jgi:hypothetical protein
MKRFLAYSAAVVFTVLLVGCAHPINMNPDLAVVTAPAGVKVIDKQVGYHIPDALRLVEVTTPGGGGDKVRYFPYRDIESGFYKVLTESFRGVTKLASPTDLAALKSAGVALVIVPTVNTTSSSESAFTWPPTRFGITLVCSVTDADGKPVQTITVNGEGSAEFSEFKSNFSLAAVRASNDALAKLMSALSASEALRK